MKKRMMTADQFIDKMYDYITSNRNFQDDLFTARQAVDLTLKTLTGDIGAAQAFVYAIGLDIDLYETELLPE